MLACHTTCGERAIAWSYCAMTAWQGSVLSSFYSSIACKLRRRRSPKTRHQSFQKFFFDKVKHTFFFPKQKRRKWEFDFREIILLLRFLTSSKLHDSLNDRIHCRYTILLNSSRFYISDWYHHADHTLNSVKIQLEMLGKLIRTAGLTNHVQVKSTCKISFPLIGCSTESNCRNTHVFRRVAA